MNENNIIGYSERGIMNAIAYTIGKNVEDFKEFIKLAKTPLELEDENNISRFDLYIEHSLSDFGDADMIALVYYKNYENEEKPKTAIFFEAKVKTYKPKTWLLKEVYNDFKVNSMVKNENYDGYFSNLYYQLYAKKLFFENRKNEDKKLTDGVDDPLCELIDNKTKKRKIGDNGVVLNLKDKFNKCTQAYYIAIVPEDVKKGKYVDENNDKVRNLTHIEIEDKNQSKYDNLPFSYIDIHYITWEAIYDEYVKKGKKDELELVFKHNEGQIYGETKK
jgi:hypothetical protein